MKTEESIKSSLPDFDCEEEMQRWNQVFKILNEPEPTIGHTPKNSVWKKNKSELWHYPAKEKKYKIPLLFVYSLFNKPYILDIAPKASVIESLTNRGYEVYLLDWGSPGYEDKIIGLDRYIQDYLSPAVKRVIRHSGAEEITLVGYCLGGTIASIYTSITEEPIKNLIVAAVPIDFETFIGPEKWAEGLRKGIIDIDRFVDVYGIVPPAFVEGMFRAISAPFYFSHYTTLLNRAYDPQYVDKWRLMNKWTTDQVPIAGEAFRQLFVDLFKENKLVKGELMVGNKKASLGNIKANLFVVSSANDHLILESQSLPIMDLVSSKDKTYKLVEAGHVSLALTGLFAPIIDEWASSRSNPI